MKRITPQVIRVRDFRSFNEEQVVSLAAEGGILGLITGVNEAEPDLGANGTGKSTIWDALCWCLFGKTIRGLRGPALLPWGVDVATPRVQFTFEVEGHRYTISRTANPNGVRLFREAQGPGADTSGLSGEEMDQAAVERLIGMDYEMFMSTVVRGQFSDSFLEMTPRKKMEFLSTALDLDTYSDAAARASEERKVAKAAHADLVRELDRQVGAANACKAGLGAATEAEGMAREKAAEDNAARELELLKADDEIEGASRALAAALEAADATAAKRDRVVESLTDLRVKAEQQLATSQTAGQKLAGLEAREEMLQEALSAAESLSGACPTCHSDLDSEARTRALSTAQANLKELQKEATPARVDARTQQTLYDDLVKRGKAARKSEKSLTSELEEQTQAAAGLQRRLDRMVQSRESLLVPAKVNPALIQATMDAEVRYDEASTQAEATRVAVEASEAKLLELDFWVKGFQDIRLWLLRAALDELEALSNSHTLSLGLRGWRILYEVERETKSGGIAKGFRCLIQSPTNLEPVPLESWSGGELQRLKIATQAAMCDLIRSRFGVAMALEVYDEPGQHLSSRGCADMMHFFRERAWALDIEIWIVDHRSTTSGEFDQQLVVTKRKDGTIVKRGLR